MKTMKRLILAATMCLSPLLASAQGDAPSGAKIPIRRLGAMSAASKDSLGTQVAVRGMSNGAVLVNDFMRRRVVSFDAALSHMTSAIDSASSNGSAMATMVPSTQLIRYAGDSSLFVDVATQALLVLDANGKSAHVMALPHPTDALFIAIGQFGNTYVDPQGRLVYRGAYPPKIKAPEPGSRVMMSIPESPDSSPLLRADFEARKVDTLGTVKAIKPGAISVEQDGQGNLTLKTTVTPLNAADEWTMLSDGTIAIVRAHDYRIDFIDTDGTKRAGPKMAFDWKRLTDEQKQFKIDSLKPLVEKQLASSPAQTIPTPDGPRRLRPQIEFAPINQMPDYEPPITPGSVKADLNGSLWIAPRTSASSDGGVLYDVVNRKGEVAYRVQFPKGYALAGFGPNKELFVLRVDGKVGFLEKTKMP